VAQAYLERDELEKAERIVQDGLHYDPDYPWYWAALGEIQDRKGQREAARKSYRQALGLAPRWTEIANNLAVLEWRAGHSDEALAILRRSLARQPDAAVTWMNLAQLLAKSGRGGDALEAWDRALALDPDWAEAHYGKGLLLRSTGEYSGAIESFHRAARLKPDWNLPHHNIGEAHLRLSQSGEAIESYRRAIRISPGFHPSHANLGVALLQEGQFEEGWKEFEWRFGAGGRVPRRPGTTAPVWDGRPMDGETLMVWMEQSLGDMIQFARFLSLAAGLGARILLQTPAPLARLLAGVAGVVEVVCGSDPACHYDLQIPLMSLPGVLGVGMKHLPGSIPYVRGDEAGEFAPDGDSFRVGIVWAGSQGNPAHLERDCGVDLFSRLAMLPGVCVYSLQFGERSGDLRGDVATLIRRAAGDLGDFARTAALAARMDLIVTVDTAMAHLAGALGKAVWTLLPEPADWRWMRERCDSPWYPTMRLFRQARRGDWGEVIERVALALAEEVRQRHQRAAAQTAG